ncbi:MAG TPA: GNAT family N-acetyltransferase [Fimbriimonas sp.]|nr:GNAT family N-acetyltransferase [Fimbriimonas sp.]
MIEFREPVTDAEWQALCDIRNLYHWNDAISVERVRSLYDIGRTQRTEFRLNAFEDGQTAAYVGGSENKNAGEEGVFWAYAGFDPSSPRAKELASVCWNHLVQILPGFGCRKAQLETRSTYECEIEVLEELGFEKSMTLPFSGVMVQETNFTRHPDVVSYAEYAAQRPDDWLKKLWRLEMDICADLPLPYPFVETPYETFAERVNDPTVDKRTKYLMKQGDEIVGMTQLWYSTVTPQYAATGLTGSLRSVRRQGVATKLKQHSLAIAKEDGIEQVFTDNEENNPMFILNQQLGFKKIFDYYVYSKNVG